MSRRQRIAENILVEMMAAAGLRGAETPFEKAFDGAELLAYMVADMIGEDEAQKALAFKAALIVGGRK